MLGRRDSRMGGKMREWIYEQDEKVEQTVALVKRVRPLFFDQGMASRVREKGAADFVTAVDFSVQDTIEKGLEQIAPGVQFMGEEKDNRDIDFSGSFWILDPVDGTTNLIHDYRQSAVSLALCEQGQLTLGIIYQPYTGELFLARRGMGATWNGQPIHVSDASAMKDSMIAVGTTPYNKEMGEENFRNFYDIFMACEDIRRSGSAAIDLASVACGRVEAYFERNLKPWDFAAGCLLIQEAGGTVTDFSGGPVKLSGPCDIVGGNQAIHKILVTTHLSGKRS